MTDGTAKHIGWDKVGFQCLPTYASDKYEMRIDMDVLGAKSGDTVSLQFAGSDALDQPAEIVLQDASPSPATKQDWAKAKGTFRVVNQNTLSNGLADAERGPKFKRLFAAINADAYCFQEEWKQDQFQTGTAHTWRGLKADESFWPGRLDLVSTTGFQAVNGKVFDTGRLAEAELEKLGVEKTDSFASDHLMLVVDCELR